jgi:hypothetical protein
MKSGGGLVAAQRFLEVSEDNGVSGLLTVSPFAMASTAQSAARTKSVGDAAILGD